MKLVKLIKQWVLDQYEFDRKAEALIHKSFELFQRGGTINHWRAIRLYYKIRKTYGCDIWPGIKIGEGTYFAHAQGISIGPTSEIGKNCRIYPSCSFGSAVVGDEKIIKQGLRRHPKVGDNCLIGEGCRLVGRITVGRNVVIGVGAVVRKDIPSYAIVFGNPAKIVGFSMRPDEAYQNELDNYPEEERIPLETLEKNYQKFFVERMKEIRDFEKL